MFPMMRTRTPPRLEPELCALTFVRGVDGPLTQRHPDLCQELLCAASAAGVEVHRSVEVLDVQAGSKPAVVWRSAAGVVRTDQARLIVGADGRNSLVRRRLGIRLQRDAPHHLSLGYLSTTSRHGRRMNRAPVRKATFIS